MVPRRGLIYDYFYARNNFCSWNQWHSLVVKTDVPQMFKVPDPDFCLRSQRGTNQGSWSPVTQDKIPSFSGLFDAL